MLSLSQTVGYAVLALGCIASWKGDQVLSNQVQKCTGIPMPYLRKILFILSKAGILEGTRGRKGGFRLARPAKEISLLDVMRVVGNDSPIPDCLLELPGCSDETPCPLRGFWQKERAKIEAKLGKITIAEAAESVVTARWGKLTCCPPDDETPQPCGPEPPSTGKQAKSPKATAKRKKARSPRRK